MSIKIQIRNNKAFSQHRRKMFPYDAKMSKIRQEPSSEEGELQEPRWPTCHSPSLLFLTKAFFSFLPPSFPPPGLRGRSRPPRRLQTDVLGGAEHALLDVTSSYGAVKEAKGLPALQRPQYKSQTIGFELVCLLPSP